MGHSTLADQHGRVFESLRVSVTDRCNFRCSYCMPAEGIEWFPRSRILSYEEIHQVVQVAARMGIRGVRVTGGEPLLRRDLHRLVRLLARVEGVLDLSLTTNGAFLPPVAAGLKDAGLRRVNISLDSLDRERFRRLTRKDMLDRVLEGIDAALSVFGTVKVNAVLMRGENEHEVIDFARLAREKGLEARFIEFMPLDAGSGWNLDSVVPGSEALRRVQEVYPLVPKSGGPASRPSRDYGFADGAPGGVGFINPVTEPFCERCDRMRLTCDGKLYNCMFDQGAIDVKQALRSGTDPDLLAALLEERLRASARAKGPGGLLEIQEAEHYRELRNMSRLGG